MARFVAKNFNMLSLFPEPVGRSVEFSSNEQVGLAQTESDVSLRVERFPAKMSAYASLT